MTTDDRSRSRDVRSRVGSLPFAALSVAQAMRACLPMAEEFPELRLSELEAARASWGRCLGALAQGLERDRLLPGRSRIAFYRAAGLEIHD